MMIRYNISRVVIAKDRVSEIERDTLDKPDTVQVIQDPVQIQNIGYEIGRAAKDEILIIYSSPNAFHRQEKLGAIQKLTETVEESGVKARVLDSSRIQTS